MILSFRLDSETVSKALAIALIFFIPISTTLTQVIMGLLVLIWFSTGNIKEKFRIAFEHPIARAACLLFIFFILATTYTTAAWHEALTQLKKMSKLLCFIFLLPLFRTSFLRTAGVWTFILAMMLTLILSLLKVYGDLPLPTRHNGASIFKNHIDTNLMMSVSLFFMGHWLKTIFQKTKVFGIVLVTFMVLTIFYCLWMSDGRTGYVIFILLWIIFCLQRLSAKMFPVGMGLLVMVVSMAMISPSILKPQPKSQLDSQSKPQLNSKLQQRVTQLPYEISLYRQGHVSSVGERLTYITYSLKLIKHHPLSALWGWGTGSFRTAYEKAIQNTDLGKTTNPHNEYINMLIQWGMIGLGGLFTLFWMIFRMSFKLPPPERYLAQGILATIMVGSLANSLLMDITPGYLFVIMTAICFSAYPIQQKKNYPVYPSFNPLKNSLVLEIKLKKCPL